MAATNIEYSADGLQNLVTGLGTTRDAEAHNTWVLAQYDRSELLAAYSSDWLAQRIVDVPVEEIGRNWRTITTPSMSPEQVDAFEAEEKRLGVKRSVKRALKWGRLFGGGGLYISEDWADPLEPLNAEKIPRGAVVQIIDMDRDDVTPARIEYDEYSKYQFMTPVTYWSNRSAARTQFDASRFIRFDGVDLPRDLWELNGYWGGSLLKSALKTVERCDEVTAALAQLAKEANVDVIAIPKLIEKLSSSATAERLRQRFAEGALVKSLYKMLLLDTNEVYSRKELGGSLAGLVQLLASYYQLPAAASGIPVTKLLGISPGGLNATGESDLENYYSMVDAIRFGVVADALSTIDAIICQTLFGKTFLDWSYDWAPLWQASAKERSDTASQDVNQLVALFDRGVIPASTVATEVQHRGYVTSITDEYIDALKEIEGDDGGVDETADPSIEPVPGGPGAASTSTEVQKEALAGAQVDKVTAIVEKVNRGQLSRNQAFGILSVALPSLGVAEINAILGTPDDIASVRQAMTEAQPQVEAPPQNEVTQ